MDEAVIVRVCMALKQTAALDGDCIFREGERGDEMYRSLRITMFTIG
jgi:hypothetical protein